MVIVAIAPLRSQHDAEVSFLSNRWRTLDVGHQVAEENKSEHYKRRVKNFLVCVATRDFVLVTI